MLCMLGGMLYAVLITVWILVVCQVYHLVQCVIYLVVDYLLCKYGMDGMLVGCLVGWLVWLGLQMIECMSVSGMRVEMGVWCGMVLVMIDIPYLPWELVRTGL